MSIIICDLMSITILQFWIIMIFQTEPAETAYVRFTPNSPLSDFANEVYNPPFTPDDDPTQYVPKGEKNEIISFKTN